MGKTAISGILRGLFVVVAFPLALLAGFGRFTNVFQFFAHACAQAPGLPGDYLRVAFYRLTLESSPPEWRIQFGSFFAHPQARVGHRVYIGAYSVLGRVAIGDRTQIASAVQVLSGRRQHSRDAHGALMGSNEEEFEHITIGQDCWIGAGAIVMADVGDKATVGAGSVVTRVVPAGAVVAGNPARALKESVES